MQKTIFRSYAASAEGNPAGCDHVAVGTDDGADWGCFGRGIAALKNAPDCHQVAEGQGYRRWAGIIEGGDNAGLVNEQSGRCHNVANRILAVAGADVRTAGSDVVILFVYGKYGFNIPGFLQRVKAGADQVNTEAPETLSADDVQSVIEKINNVKQDELDIIEEYFEKALGNTNFNLSQDEKAGIGKIYNDFFEQRVPIQSLPGSYFDNLKPVALKSLLQLEALLGNDRFLKVFTAAPQFVADALKPGISLAGLAK